MRLWHIDLIEYLPNSQLVAQWRELNSVFTHQTKHILINYIYNYEKKYLLAYTEKVLKEMKNRNIRVYKKDNYKYFFDGVKCKGNERYPEHDYEYLVICYFNLREKYIRGQKDFTDEVWNKLKDFCLKENEK